MPLNFTSHGRLQQKRRHRPRRPARPRNMPLQQRTGTPPQARLPSRPSHSTPSALPGYQSAANHTLRPANRHSILTALSPLALLSPLLFRRQTISHPTLRLCLAVLLFTAAALHLSGCSGPVRRLHPARHLHHPPHEQLRCDRAHALHHPHRHAVNEPAAANDVSLHHIARPLSRMRRKLPQSSNLCAPAQISSILIASTCPRHDNG